MEVIHPENTNWLATKNNLYPWITGTKVVNYDPRFSYLLNHLGLGMVKKYPNNKYNQMLFGESVANDYNLSNLMQMENENDVGKPRNTLRRYSNQYHDNGELESQSYGLSSLKQDETVGKDLSHITKLRSIMDEANDLEVESHQNEPICIPSRDTTLTERNDNI